jgi:hypothetical protein
LESTCIILLGIENWREESNFESFLAFKNILWAIQAKHACYKIYRYEENRK